MSEISESVMWGYPTMAHFFLAALGGGALTTSAILLLLGRRRGALFDTARYAAFIAPTVVLTDGFVLILELGRPSRFANIFRHVNFESPLWIGSWLMVAFILVSLVYAYTYLALPGRALLLRRAMARLGVPERVGPWEGWVRLRAVIALIGLPLGIAVCHYPGFMMSGLVARPLWSTALLPTLFLCSGMVTGIAATLLCRIALRRATDIEARREYRDTNHLLVSTIVILLLAEAFGLLQIVVYARNTSASLQHVINELIMTDGLLRTEFWLGAVGVGFVIPIVCGVALIAPRTVLARDHAFSRPVEAIMPSAVLVGSLMLTYVILFGGQMTGPIGL